MDEEKGTARYTTDHGEIKLSPTIIRKYLVSGKAHVTDQEVMMFLTLCKYQQLNPFLREAYLIKYSNDDPATIVVGKDVHVKRASKHPQFDGMESGVIIGKDGRLEERAGSFTLPDEQIVGGWAIGHRKDWGTPRKITVSFEEYAVHKRGGELNRSWSKMPGTMIVKVAEAQCLRAMFPEELQALYNAEEMAQEPGDLMSLPVPQGETPDAVREQIHKLIDDNPDILAVQYAESVNAEMYATDDTRVLATIKDAVATEIKRIRGKETREQTKENFAKAAETYAREAEEPPLPDPKPDPPGLFEGDEKEIF